MHLNTQDTVRVVLSYDPAIDVARMLADPDAMPRYVRSRAWQDLEPLLIAGAQAQVFHLRHLTGDEVVFARSGGSDDERARRAFCCAVVKVENATDLDGVTNTFKPSGKTIARDELDQYWDMAAVAEIGGFALTRSFLRRTKSVTFELPPTSLVILNQAISRHVASRAQQASSDLSKPSSDAAPHTSVNVADQSAPGGDVAATG